jgi:hypothetical protein
MLSTLHEYQPIGYWNSDLVCATIFGLQVLKELLETACHIGVRFLLNSHECALQFFDINGLEQIINSRET